MTTTATPAPSAHEIAVQYEARVLGSLLQNPEQFSDVADIIGFDDFVGPYHMEIFSTISGLFQAKEPIHPLAVHEVLARTAALQGATTPVTLASLTTLKNNASHAGARSDAKKVRDRSAMRRLANTGVRITELAQSATVSPEQILEELAGEFESVSTQIKQRGPMAGNFIPLQQAMTEYVVELDALATNPEVNDGIKTGIESLDEYFGVLDPGYHVLAARPGSGKTAVSLQITTGAYETTTDRGPQPVSTLIHSIDMKTKVLMRRMLAQKSSVDMQRLRRGDLQAQDWTQIAMALDQMREMQMWIDPTRQITTSDLKARIRLFQREKTTRNGLVIVDYIQQVKPPMGLKLIGLPMDYVSAALADIAKEEEIILIALAQLNREGEKRANKRPVMSDLKGSGNIEQDADSISFLYRDPKTPEYLEYIVAKNREGQPDKTIDLGFNGSKQKISFVEQRTPEQRMGLDGDGGGQGGGYNGGNRQGQQQQQRGSFRPARAA